MADIDITFRRTAAAVLKHMKRKFIYGMVTTVLAINAIVGAFFYVNNVSAATKDDPYPNLQVFMAVMESVRQEYVDGEGLTYEQLVNGALKGMLNTLDPHSEFMQPRKYNELKKDTEGEYGGVGIVVNVQRGKVTIVAPMEDSPGFEAGLKVGDQLMKVEGESVEGDLDETVQLLRGKAGTDVTVTLYRASTDETKDLKMERRVIKVSTVTDINGRTEYPVSDDGIGYVRLLQFGDHTAEDLEKALKKLEKNDMSSLVLDLRDNPGGLLDQAVYVAEKFLPKGQMIVSTEGRGAVRKEEYRAKGRGKIRDLPMVVLVNGGSASAAEIVSGCLQDLKRAVVIGEQTFGKGSVQSILPLGNGSALRLTTARYYTPSHKVIHENGIKPDIIVGMSDDELGALRMRQSPGGFKTLNETDQERLRVFGDPQFERARDVFKGVNLFSNRTASRDVANKLEAPGKTQIATGTVQ